jgi:hypothetical protein
VTSSREALHFTREELCELIARVVEEVLAARASLIPDDLTQRRARRTLEECGELLTRAEAAAFTRRCTKTFDKTLRPHLRNVGTEHRPLFLVQEINEWLRNQPPGPSIDAKTAGSIAYGFPIKATVSRNPLARATLTKLRSVARSSTQKR